MKKIVLIIIAVSLNSMLISCTENEEIVKNDTQIEKTQSCCGEDGVILPPPPPPPPPGG